MAVIHGLVNKGYCAQIGMSGTSNDFCPLDIDQVSKLLRFPFGYKLADDFEPTEENFNLLTQSGVMTPIYTVIDGIINTGDNEVQTFTGGDMKDSNFLPVMIEGKVLNGIQGYQNTLSVARASAHSFFIVDKKGTIFGFKDKNDKFRPINSNYFSVSPYKKEGTDSAGYGIKLQLNRNQFDSGLSGLRSEDYDFEIDDIKGFTNLEISIPVAPVTGATTVGFKVLRKEDRVPQLGLTDNEIKVYVNGVDGSASLLALGDGNYSATDLTALTLGSVVDIKTNDGTYDVVEVTATGTLLKSKVAQTVVVAP